MELIGKRFGRLKVIENDKLRPYYVICECECGNSVSVRRGSLTKSHSPTRSCGCLRRETASAIGSRTIYGNFAKTLETNQKYGTNFQIIGRTTPSRNNRSGYTGVWFDPARGKYEAYISLHKRRICLGRFSNLNDAIAARRQAEEQMFAPLIAAKCAETM